MIALNKDCPANCSDWQTGFLSLLPEIERRLKQSFRDLDFASQEEAVEEATVHCLLAYIRLYDQGRTHVATPGSLAYYSGRQVRCGRPAVGRMTARDPLSRYAQLRRGIEIERDEWIDQVVFDCRAPVPDQVIARVDVRAWWGTLTHHMRLIANDLAYGHSTSEVARKHNLSASRISQLRRALEKSWASFQQELAPAVAR